METNLKDLDVNDYKYYVKKIANSYQVSNDVRTELIQEGLIGVYEASLKYDPIHGNSFISFATTYIKKNMSIYLMNNLRTVRVPSNKLRALRKYQAIEDPDTADLSEFSKSDLLFINSNGHKPELSTDEPINDESDSTLLDVYQPSDEERPEIIDKMLKAVNELPENDRYLITAYYGLIEDSKTLEAIGQEQNLTRERIRQKIAAIQKKLKEILK
ncbi:MAG: polymerase subunit sigma [Bacteroidetes bacterium]|jgi:RNA polymerase sigma factor (sigma-70 family)|nr:polymerase subunit sigma [Bacteroidota bacterium]